MGLISRKDPLARPLVFITGAPRSGTSMVTKIIDAHPRIAVLMENIFQNRRRHWTRADFWNSEETLRREVASVYARLSEPIVGNKVCTPSVWSAEDIAQFCQLFAEFKILFVVRDPIDVCLSRFRREDYRAEFTDAAKTRLLLDFRSQALAYTSSWRQSIDEMRRLRDAFSDKVFALYYEDLCADFEPQTRRLFSFLGVPWHPDLSRWHELPHRDANGNLAANLKYEDQPAERKAACQNPEQWPAGLEEALATIREEIERWRARTL